MDNPASAVPTRVKDIPVNGGPRVQCQVSLDVARLDGGEGVPVDVLEHPPGQPPGTSAGSTSPTRRQPFDSSHVRGAATSAGRSWSA